MAQRAETPPIEFVAARLRELRRTAVVLSASPDIVSQRDDELRRVSASHDEWLLIAARQVGIDLDIMNDGDGTGLPAGVRSLIEHGLTSAGWVLDF